MNALALLKLYASSSELLDKKFVSNQGTKVIISEIKNIDYDQDAIFAHGRFSIDGAETMGRMVIVENSSAWRQNALSLSINIDLMVVLSDDGLSCNIDGSIIPTIQIELESSKSIKLQSLIDGAAGFGCGEYIASLDTIRRVELCTKLLIERVEMKSKIIEEIFDKTSGDWNETFYIMLVKMMGMGTNADNYIRVAQRVTYKMLCREKHSQLAVEAMLLGAAGFLENPIDKYEMSLSREFKHLQNKYNIRPLRKSDWTLKDRKNVRPSSLPVLRIAQIAALICSKDFLFDNAMKCRTMSDLEKLLYIKASEYWDTHYTFGMATSTERKKTISSDTTDVLGINVVCMIMFCYGRYTLDEKLQEASLDLLEKIKTERNSLILGWTRAGVEIENASFSQAMLQLSKIYCRHKRCSECFVGKARLKSE